MEKILVTGATGAIGKGTIEHLLKKGIPASNIMGLSRKKVIPNLVDRGVEVRFGDYMDYDSLLDAFKGIDKIMLTSAIAFSDRFTQHYNVITAARQAGVRHVVYMSIMRQQGSRGVMPEITESDLFTEQLLKSSGLEYTIVYHPPFMDSLPVYYGSSPYETGISVPAANGKMAAATRDELAEAHAEILSNSGHLKQSYSLGGSYSISFADIAKILEETTGKRVHFSTITENEYIDSLVSKGTSHKVAQFLANWIMAIEGAEFEHQSGDLEKLLGRKTTSFRNYLMSKVGNVA